MTDRRVLHAQALSDADRRVSHLGLAELAQPSACAGWTVLDLVEHMTGQNLGFAAAIGLGDAPESSYAPRPVQEWAASVQALRAAIADPFGTARLVEVAPDRPLSLDAVLGIHALDLAAHTWDLDRNYRPHEQLAELVRTLARRIPPREAMGGQFAPAISGDTTDPWKEALALLGRN